MYINDLPYVVSLSNMFIFCCMMIKVLSVLIKTELDIVSYNNSRRSSHCMTTNASLYLSYLYACVTTTDQSIPSMEMSFRTPQASGTFNIPAAIFFWSYQIYRIAIKH